MARLRGPIQFTGSLGDISAYTTEGSDAIFLRRKTGPTSKQFKTSDAYELPRKNAREFGGCGRAAGLVMDAFDPLRPLPLQGTSGKLTGLLIRVQKAELKEALGRRSIRLAQAPHLWAEFALNKGTLMDAVLRAPLTSTLSRAEGHATVEVPALTTGANFFPHGGLPLYRIAVSLGVLPDMVYHEVRESFYPAEDFEKVWPVGTTSAWLPVKTTRSEALTLELALPTLPSTDNYSLILCAAIHFGTVGPMGEVVPEKKWGCAKVLRVG